MRTIVLVQFLERIFLEVDPAVFVASVRGFEGDLRGGLEGRCARLGGCALGGCWGDAGGFGGVGFGEDGDGGHA